MALEPGAPRIPEGVIDRCEDGRVYGWAWNPAEPDAAIGVELRWGGRTVAAGPADLPRDDLKAAGMGSGRHGFLLAIPPATLAALRGSAESLVLVPLGRPDLRLSAIDLSDRAAFSAESRSLLRDRLAAFEATHALDDPWPEPALARAERPAYAALVERDPAKPDTDPRFFPYAEQVWQRYGLETRFDPHAIPGDLDHLLHWYVLHYNAPRAPLRAPLGAAAIEWLNEPVTLGGRAFPLTRAMLWFMADEHDLLASLDDANRYLGLVYAWACRLAPRLNVEDCLVTRYHIELLRGVPEHSRRQAFGLSRFMEMALAERPEFAGHNRFHDAGSRLGAYVAVILHAADEPALLRYVPAAVLAHLFGGGAPAFDGLMADLGGLQPGAEPAVTAARFRRLLRGRGFDLDRLRFDSIDRRGNRLEGARPILAAERPVTVQLVGPLGKASGVGRAARGSRAALERTGLDCAFTDFDLDNPQPDDAGRGDDASGPRRARIDLIHLNADMLPLPYAYRPGFGEGAYAIGFFFWELDRPADCHRLALDLVDEVWVASEYNRSCFAAATDKPVINVGMALPPVGRPAVAGDRERRRARLGLERDDFVFLATFDSLSFAQRKNPLGLIRAFRDAFGRDAGVRLVLKTHNAAAVEGDLERRIWDGLLRAVDADPRIVVLNETLALDDLMALKAACDCYVSLHRSEGFGFGMVEAMALGVPVVCTAHGGNLDFCNDHTAWLVPAAEVGVRHDLYAYVAPGHRWAEPDRAGAAAALRAVMERPEERRARAEAAAAFVAERYSVPAAARRYRIRLEEILAVLNGATRPG